MPDKEQSFVVVPELKWPVEEIKECASLKGIYLPYCEFDFSKFNFKDHDSFCGKRTSLINYKTSTIIIEQEGHFPVIINKLGDYFTDFHCSGYHEDKKAHLENKVVQRISGKVNTCCPALGLSHIRGVVELYFEGNNDYYVEINAGVSPHYNNLKFYERKGILKQFRCVGKGDINAHFIRIDEDSATDSKLGEFVKNIFKKFKAESTKTYLVIGEEKKLEPWEIDASELALYLLLTENKNFKLLNRVRSLVSGKEIEKDLSIAITEIRSDEEEDSKRLAFSLDGKVLQSNEDYRLFSSKECQEALSSLTKLYQMAETKYSSLLKAIGDI